MKELIEELNLPKQILDKTDKFLTTLFGPSMKEIGELFADKIRFKRLKNQIDIFKKTIEIIEKKGVQVRELNLKTLIPLIEKSSLEEEKLLQEKWSNLIANISSTPENGLEPKLIQTLSSLSSQEARILDFIYTQYLYNRKQKFKESINNEWNIWKKETDIPLYYVLILFEKITEKFNLTSEFISIYIDNLESLGLLRYEEPEIEVDNGYPSGDAFGKSVEIVLDVTATSIRSENFYLTAYGKYFINQCKIEI